MTHYREFFYTIDRVEKDEALFFDMVAHEDDCEDTETYDFLEVLARQAAVDYFYLNYHSDDLAGFPDRFYLYDTNKTLLAGFTIKAEHVGNFDFNIQLEPIKLAA